MKTPGTRPGVFDPETLRTRWLGLPEWQPEPVQRSGSQRRQVSEPVQPASALLPWALPASSQRVSSPQPVWPQAWLRAWRLLQAWQRVSLRPWLPVSPRAWPQLWLLAWPLPQVLRQLLQWPVWQLAWLQL